VVVARRWIFPILRILVFALIAAALVKLAFFADATEADSPAVPTGSVTDPVVTVELGTIVNDVTLAGTVSADAAVPVRATGQGTVDEVFIPQGATVSQGDKIFDIKVETPQDPVETTDAQGMVTVTQPKPLVTYAKVFAPVSGTLSSLTVLSGQAVAVGDQAGAVAPPSFSVSGPLGPEQQYRLLDRPTEASVTIVGGPAPFTCAGLTITAPLPGQTSGDGEAAPPAGATVRCAVPADVTVFSGLAATITIPAGTAENVLVVPTTAVEGGAQTGVVYAALPDGGSEPRDVTLGMTDGAMVEVTGGLEQGDSILQFTPNASAPVGGDCVDDGTGNVVCGGVGIAK
jgi:macrolide-specific efflux system membrane fusion protein